MAGRVCRVPVGGCRLFINYLPFNTIPQQDNETKFPGNYRARQIDTGTNGRENVRS
jgi:hypothetical protein